MKDATVSRGRTTPSGPRGSRVNPEGTLHVSVSTSFSSALVVAPVFPHFLLFVMGLRMSTLPQKLRCSCPVEILFAGSGGKSKGSLDGLCSGTRRLE